MQELPPGYVARAATPDDVEALVRMINACEIADIGEPQVDAEDVLGDWRRPGFDLELDGVLVVDESGSIVGNGEVFAGRAEGNVLPEHEGRGIGTFVASWIERRARTVGAAFVRQVVPASATHRLELLSAAGYEVSDTAWELRIGSDAVGARPPLAAGVDVCDLRPGVDEEAAWRVIEDAFSEWPNREPNPFERWRAAYLERSGFEPSLLPLLWRDGEVVGAAYCIDYPELDQGWVQQVAVPAAHRGQGLGTQLLHEAFERFAARGRTSVGLATDSRTGALDLYLSTGMHVEREFLGHLLTLAD